MLIDFNGDRIESANLFLLLQMSNLRKQILNKSLPPVGPLPSRNLSSTSTKKSPLSTRTYTPVEWSSYFDDKRHLTIGLDSFCLYSRHTSDSLAPVLFFLHGGGFSGLSWAVLSKAVTDLVHCQCIALDLRGHGGTSTNDETDLSIDVLTDDVCQVLKYLYSEKQKPPIFLIGHSMGTNNVQTET